MEMNGQVLKETSQNGCNKAVAILLSTYNGRNYIERQLKSIADQTYENIKIFIRDDGSNDGTETLIEKFITQNHLENKVTMLNDFDGNLGFGRSFYKLANSVTGCDYYFFCDQDDYWFPDKVERAVRLLERESDQEMICYMSNYYVGNDHLEVKGKAFNHNIALEQRVLRKQMFENTSMIGMVTAINETFRKIAFSLPDCDCMPCSHDKWVAVVLAGLHGKFIYDEAPTAIQRRHQSTTSACNQTFTYKWIWRIKNIIKGNHLWQIRQMILLCQKLYGNQIDQKSEKFFLDVFTRSGITGYIARALFPYRLREKVLDEILLRILFVVGKYDRA